MNRYKTKQYSRGLGPKPSNELLKAQLTNWSDKNLAEHLGKIAQQTGLITAGLTAWLTA